MCDTFVHQHGDGTSISISQNQSQSFFARQLGRTESNLWKIEYSS